jgi:hypothetical protein
MSGNRHAIDHESDPGTTLESVRNAQSRHG